VSEGELLELLASGGLRRAHVAAQLAVDLEDNLDFVLLQGRFVDDRPRRREQISVSGSVTEVFPKCVRDMRRNRVEQAKQDAHGIRSSL
jgi:hypothetical protein